MVSLVGERGRGQMPAIILSEPRIIFMPVVQRWQSKNDVSTCLDPGGGQ